MSDENQMQPLDDAEARRRRLELARQAFQNFRILCFWSWRDDPEITQDTIPLIVRGLRLHGGHKGYRVASEICR